MSDGQAATAASKTVVVTGDLLIDHNLLPDERQGASYSDSLASTIELTAPGAAWFLTQLIERVTQSVFPTPGLTAVEVHGPDANGCETRCVAKAYTRWGRFKKLHESKDDEPRVYRVEQFLGCQRASNPCEECYRPTSQLRADLLVVDDLRLGFMHHDQLWPKPLQDVWSATRSGTISCELMAALPRHIVLKLGGPPDGSPLWKLLLETPELRQRLTVVIYAGHLRERGSELSCGLSWDRTIEELQQEFRQGPSAYDLGWCQRVIVVFEGGSAGAVVSHEPFPLGRPTVAEPSPRSTDEYTPPTLQRFLYLPEEVEGIYSDCFGGKVFGAMSLVTAGYVLHLLDPENVPSYLALGRGLAALRHNQLKGTVLEPAKENAADAIATLVPDFLGLTCRFAWKDSESSDAQSAPAKVRDTWAAIRSDPAFAYFTSWPHGDDDPISPEGRGIPGRRPGSTADVSCLLGDFAGPTLEYMYAVAARIVSNGVKSVLKGVPRAAYAKYLTVDREEIERINAVRGLILTYLRNRADTRPLSIAVFGQPGSGKSFAIKQLLKSLPGRDPDPLTFNLSEFPEDSAEALRQLQSALHQVRDKSIKGAVPLVFWDEFDTNNLKWLKQFLAPMQDAEFRSGSLVHPLGRAIFIFAGGTCHKYEEFEAKATMQAASKGPDFVSRLRGHINIKGPNRDTTATPKEPGYAGEDPAHLIRRAIIIRSKLEENYPHLICPETKRAAVSESVIRGLLRVRHYRHGARSLEAVLSMSQIANAKSFGSSQLPPQEQLRMHVTADFLDRVREGELSSDIIEPLAEACHRAYQQLRAGLGDKSVLDYSQLTDDLKEPNRAVARVVCAKLDDIGYTIRRRQSLGAAPAPLELLQHVVGRLGRTVGDALCRFEHDRSLREKLMLGFEYVARPTRVEPTTGQAQLDTAEEQRLKSLRRNTNIRRYDDLDADFRQLDEIAPREIIQKLWEFGYAVIPQLAAVAGGGTATL